MTNSQDEKLSGQRVQASLLAGIEKKALLWFCPRLPAWVTPDQLTYLGLAAMALLGLSYYLASFSDFFLVVASIGHIINWFGDSMDGTLARYRNQQRPRYGYYLDHLVDAFGVAFMIFGLAYSGLVSQPFVWLVLSLFFIASINTYLATNSVQIFKISYMRVSTTEARVLLIIMNTILIWVKKITIFGFTGYLLDFVAGAIALFLLIAIIRSAYQNLSKLDKEERAKWATKEPELPEQEELDIPDEDKPDSAKEDQQP
ncbi:MAG: CDP-alcohol phosphatidyltransferase family protein [candidate division Zixibacteria bacterium]|nr:CDP-alcohol phosphatidyltransferase family protein [candidate division Zixibacteria bacterium]